MRIVHWFDFICPFCYIAQDRNRILREAGHELVELPLQIHPEIGPGGAPAPVRVGPTYAHLATEAKAAGLELNWSPRIPYSRDALALAEAVRLTHSPAEHEAFLAAVFTAYFARGENIEDPDVLAGCGRSAGLSLLPPPADLTYAVSEARRNHVTSTPSWLVAGHLISGLHPPAYFASL
jgi:predicted DsbA family dithiol-disulfide isomerase